MPWVPRGDMGFSVYPSRLPFSVFFPSSCSVNSPYAASATEQLSGCACQPCRKTLTRSSGAHAHCHQSLGPLRGSRFFPAPPTSSKPLLEVEVGRGEAGSRGLLPGRLCMWQGGQLEEQEGTDAMGAQICSCRKNARS